MKKLLIMFVLILIVTMLAVSCKDSKNDPVSDSEDTTTVADNISDPNMKVLIDTLNKNETLDMLIPMQATEFDTKKIANELKKISLSGNAGLAVKDSWNDEGSCDYAFALKDNTFYFYSENPDAEYSTGIKGTLLSSMDLFYTGWIDDRYDGFSIDVSGSGGINLDLAYEIYMNQLEESLKENIIDLPITFSDIDLPTIVPEDITYSEGKYIINKSYISNAIVMTIDAMIDSAKNSGIEVESEEEYEEKKNNIKSFFDSSEFEIYYFVELESIKGFGISISVKANDIENAFGISSNELGINYVKACYETSDNSKKLFIEYEDMTTKYVNKMNINCEYIFDGENICGFNLGYDVDTKQSMYIEEDDMYYERYREKTTTITKQSASIMLDLSKLGDKDAQVLHYRSKAESDTTSQITIKEFGCPANTAKMRNVNKDTTSLDIKSIEQNELSINMIQSNAYEYYEEENTKPTSLYDMKTKISGNITYTTENVKIPEVPKKVDEYLDRLINNSIVLEY